MPLPARRTSNPILNERTFSSLPRFGVGAERMSLKGTIDRSFLLLVVLLVSAFWPWSQYMASGNAQAVASTTMVGLFGGLIVAWIISFKANLAPYLAIPYAALEGLALGGFSAVLEQRYHGIAIQAVGLTFGVLGALLIAYRARLIRVTERFRAMVVAATLGVLLFYVATMALGFFHVSTQALFASTPLGIGISLVIVAIAAANVVLAFDQIERGIAAGAPKFMEWYCAFGMMVTLVWLYIEIISLLAQSRRQ
jgi:uncharacterized YccA/Bax inhibitor family protein